MDWFYRDHFSRKGENRCFPVGLFVFFTGKPHISWENRWFPVTIYIFP
jgi:hypothetical protein